MATESSVMTPDDKPAYIVIWKSSQPPDIEYSPVVPVTGPLDPNVGTLPHLLDRELTPTISALWFCLHLPNTLHDLFDMSARTLKRRQDYDYAHEILLCPDTVNAV